MTELDMTADVETDDFTDELSDEALDRSDNQLNCNAHYCMSGIL